MTQNPYKDTLTKKWFWYDETTDNYGPYDTWEEANEDLQIYIEEVLGK